MLANRRKKCARAKAQRLYVNSTPTPFRWTWKILTRLGKTGGGRGYRRQSQRDCTRGHVDLGAGTGTFRVREMMHRIAYPLGVHVRADVN